MDISTLNTTAFKPQAPAPQALNASPSLGKGVDRKVRHQAWAPVTVLTRGLRRLHISTLKGLARFAVVMGAGATLTACYVIPINPSTGQPYAAAARPTGYPAAYANASNGNGDYSPTPLYVPPAAPNAPVSLNVRLYPVNAQANRGGVLAASVVDNNAGHGTFTVPYLGDNLQGESTRVDASYAAFGRIYADVLGAGARAFTGRRGIANAHGAKGVNAQCEYVLTGPGSGTGVCQFSDGANYQMHFGG